MTRLFPTALATVAAVVLHAQAVLEPVTRTVRSEKSEVLFLAMAPKGDRLLVGTAKGADVVDIESGKRVFHLAFEEDGSQHVWYAQFNDNGEYVMLAGFTGKREIWDMKTGKKEGGDLSNFAWMPNSLAMKKLNLKVGNSPFDRFYQQETAQHGDITAKADKDGADVDAALHDLRALDVPVLAVNAKDRTSVAALEPWLGVGRSIVLVGSSGAGKSTLTNTLLGIEKMKTGEVRESDARGRHTTTHRALTALPSGACLIDTPGMRELKPTGEEEVAESFIDIEALAAQCKFRDCKHGKEPGCAVRAAIDAGALDAERVAARAKP